MYSQFGYGKVKLGLNYNNCHNVATFLLGAKMCFLCLQWKAVWTTRGGTWLLGVSPKQMLIVFTA